MADSRFHVLQICTSQAWGGMEMVAGLLSLSLRKRGHQVTVVACENSSMMDAVQGNDITMLPVRAGGYFRFKNIKRIRQHIQSNPVNIIHSHYSKDLWQVVPAVTGYPSLPVLLTKHIGTQKSKRDLLHRWIYNRVDRIIAISEIIRKNVINTHPIHPDRVVCIHNGVDLEKFNTERRKRGIIRKQLGIPDHAKVVGILGRLTWWKGFREFLDTASAVCETENDVYFLVVGGETYGESEEAVQIRSYAEKLNLGHRLIFTGFREDAQDFLGAMDIFVYPAYAEAFGLVLIEAMAMSLPVVASDCDGIPEIVEHGKTGILVPARNSKPVTEAVLDLLSSKSRRIDYGKAGRKRAEQHFSLTRMIMKTEKLYYQLIETNKNDE